MCWLFFYSPSILSFLPSALCLKRLIILDYISCFSCQLVLPWIWPMGSSARDHGKKRAENVFFPYSLLSLVFHFWKWLSPTIITGTTHLPWLHHNIINAPHPFKPMDDGSFSLLPVSVCFILPCWFF